MNENELDLYKWIRQQFWLMFTIIIIIITLLVYPCRHKWRLFKNKSTLTTLINNATKVIWQRGVILKQN